jgi:uncharacterized protein (DUF433 family)
MRERNSDSGLHTLAKKWPAGESETGLLQAYPQLNKADLIEVWEYAARAAAEEVVLVES